jgi:hypothetical protein
MTPIELAKQILANAKNSPVTTVLAVIAIFLLGGGKVMAEHGIEPWGTAVAGIGAILVIVLGFVARDPKSGDDK